MTLRAALLRIAQHEELNFLLTNRVPRRWLTQLVGRLSRVEQPLVRGALMGLWRTFADVDLSDARTTRFASLHACFTRELREGARPVDADPRIVVSPCDGIVGASGAVVDGTVLQAKGFPYAVQDLLVDPALAREYAGGRYVTLRLTSGMYHRFHAPHDCRIDEVTYVTGDTWNVNPAALRRIERLYCRNERAVIRCRLTPSGVPLTLVPVAAILVASIRLHCVDVPLSLRYRGPNRLPCRATLRKGEELGWFEHGSTLIVFAPAGVEPCATVEQGRTVRMGQPLFRLPDPAP